MIQIYILIKTTMFPEWTFSKSSFSVLTRKYLWHAATK